MKLIKVAYYKAPYHKNIRPQHIPENHEYVELLTDGEVYFDDGSGRKAYNRGWMFWHMPGDMTIHDNNPDFPYQCATYFFENCSGGPRHVPRVTFWDDDYEVRKFTDMALKAFHSGMQDVELLSSYVFHRLRWEALSRLRPANDAKLPMPLRRSLEFIEGNFRENIQVEEIAEFAGVSVSHLFLLFRTHFKASPHSYLNSVRISEAKQLLAKSPDTIKAICFNCGFINVESFCRAFKKTAGTTPGDYRKKCSLEGMLPITESAK